MEKGPKLRHVEAFPVDTEDGKMIALRDPLGISEEIILVTQAALFILQFCDGEHSKADIVAHSSKKLGFEIEMELFENLLAHLDENYLLDNQNFRNRMRTIESALLKGEFRPAAHAGASYPAEREALAKQIDAKIKKKNGAGKIGPVNGLPTPKGIIAPHIDLRIGGSTYTHAYKRIAESPAADVYVILGTGHAGLRNVYSVLPIDFDTPLGRVETDKKFIKALEKKYAGDLYSDVFLHKSEHTIEFQTVFLKKLLGDRPFTIVPVLCSFSYHALVMDQFSREKAIIESFSQALRQTIRDEKRTVTVIASVDFAHVGPRYGDRSRPDARFLQEVESHDQAALQSALRVDADGWLKNIASVDDRYRICGFSPIYTLLSAIEAQKGELLHYEQGLMDDKQSVVSFCSAVLY